MFMSTTMMAPLIMYMYMLSAFILNNVHFLMSLLCLEGMILSLVIMSPMWMSDNSIHLPSVTLVMLTMAVCEASLGLSLLVKVSRSMGTDLMSSPTKNKC